MEKVEHGITHEIRKHIGDMSYNAIANYIVPGLYSGLIGQDPETPQKIRVFSNTRTQDMPITPHSHRFDLACMVMYGSVENTIFNRFHNSSYGDSFMASELKYGGEPGKYERKENAIMYFTRFSRTYVAGQWYFMTHEDIHSIKFSKDAMVLVFEGDPKTDTTTILEPYVDGKVIPTFKVEDWMFEHV
jgi:hypothetical protein